MMHGKIVCTDTNHGQQCGTIDVQQITQDTANLYVKNTCDLGHSVRIDVDGYTDENSVNHDPFSLTPALPVQTGSMLQIYSKKVVSDLKSDKQKREDLFDTVKGTALTALTLPGSNQMTPDVAKPLGQDLCQYLGGAITVYYESGGTDMANMIHDVTGVWEPSGNNWSWMDLGVGLPGTVPQGDTVLKPGSVRTYLWNTFKNGAEPQ